MKYLVVVDMQKDFVDGALGTPEAVAIVPRVADKILSFEGQVIATMDTHHKDYLTTQEGRHLPVEHCIEGTPGWRLDDTVRSAFITRGEVVFFPKPSFGSVELGEYLATRNRESPIEEIEIVGLCTDICVISNALLLKAFLPEVPITVDAACCAGVSPESHGNALFALGMCQIRVKNP